MKPIVFSCLLIVFFLFACKTHKQNASLPQTNPTKESAKPQTPPSQKEVVQQLYQDCNTCKILVCTRSGKTFYSTEMNAYDVSTIIYDEYGKRYAQCSYQIKDDKCNFDNCKVVFVPAKNIWGIAAVDTFGLLN